MSHLLSQLSGIFTGLAVGLIGIGEYINGAGAFIASLILLFWSFREQNRGEQS